RSGAQEQLGWDLARALGLARFLQRPDRTSSYRYLAMTVRQLEYELQAWHVLQREEQSTRVQMLIAQLDSDSFRIRTAASKELLELRDEQAYAAYKEIYDASGTGSEERKRRAEDIANQIKMQYFEHRLG